MKVYVVEVGEYDRYIGGVYASWTTAQTVHPGDWREDVLDEEMDAPATAHRRLDSREGTFHVWEYPVA